MGFIVLEGNTNDMNLRNEARVKTVLCRTDLEGTGPREGPVQGFVASWHEYVQ
jgi:hypothetical protein